MKKNKKKPSVQTLFTTIIIIVTLLISVGYSAFNTKLNVKDIKAVVRVEKDVRVTNITIKETSNGGVSNWEDYNINNISASVTLPQSTSTVTYTIEVTNIGTEEVGIAYQTYSTDNLTYEMKNYANGTKICDSSTPSKCSKGAIKKFEITVKYKSGASVSNTAQPLEITFYFKEFHNITYKNITSTNLPKEIIDGGTLNANIGTGYTSFNITQGGVKLTDSQYTYQNGRLTIKNVTGDLVIEGLKSLYNTIKAGAELDTGIYFGYPTDEGNGQGKYMFSSTSKDAYPIYYYRGDSTLNNNVLFANFCWKIVRTTNTGGIKILFSGVPENNTCPKNSFLERSSFSGKATSQGDSYYPLSLVKAKVESWYEKNLTGYTSKLEDTPWVLEIMRNAGSMNNGVYQRIISGTPNLEEPYATTLTVANGALKYPIALLTVDEAMLAGAAQEILIESDSTRWSYISSPDLGIDGTKDLFMFTFLMTPVLGNDLEEDYPSVYIYTQGRFLRESVDEIGVIKPCVSLKNNVTYTSGDGSKNNPYRIN